jgi:catechol 2,3-dioxygenase-like lactoylglutathione lyase family enzyme
VREHAIPVLPARDLAATLAFYERLGFEQQGAPWQTYRYLIVGREQYELHFYEDAEVDPLTTTAGCYLRVADADALHAAWEAVGVPHDRATGSRLVAPSTTEYGMREFALVDPSGNLLRIGSDPGGRPAP